MPGGHTAFRTVSVGERCQMSSHPDAGWELLHGTLNNLFHREPRFGFP
jgi:hypothetical protein